MWSHLYILLNAKNFFVCVCVCVLSNSSAISCPIWLKFWTKLWITKEQRVSRFRVPILSNFWFYVTFLSVTLEPTPSITHTRLRLCATITHTRLRLCATSVIVRLSRVSRQCTQFTNLKYLPRSWLLFTIVNNTRLPSHSPTSTLYAHW